MLKTPFLEFMPKVVSTVLISEAYCCMYLVAISPNSKVLISDTGSSSYASVDGYCGNLIAFSDAEIEAGSALRALDVSAEFSFIVDNNAFCSFEIFDCESTIGLYIFVSSLRSPISPNLSDKKFCLIFFLLFRNSSTIKSLFEGSVIFRNDVLFNIYYTYIFKRNFERKNERKNERKIERKNERKIERKNERKNVRKTNVISNVIS